MLGLPQAIFLFTAWTCYQVCSQQTYDASKLEKTEESWVHLRFGNHTANDGYTSTAVEGDNACWMLTSPIPFSSLRKPPSSLVVSDMGTLCESLEQQYDFFKRFRYFVFNRQSERLHQHLKIEAHLAVTVQDGRATLSLGSKLYSPRKTSERDLSPSLALTTFDPTSSYVDSETFRFGIKPRSFDTTLSPSFESSSNSFEDTSSYRFRKKEKSFALATSDLSSAGSTFNTPPSSFHSIACSPQTSGVDDEDSRSGVASFLAFDLLQGVYFGYLLDNHTIFLLYERWTPHDSKSHSFSYVLPLKKITQMQQPHKFAISFNPKDRHVYFSIDSITYFRIDSLGNPLAQNYDGYQIIQPRAAKNISIIEHSFPKSIFYGIGTMTFPQAAPFCLHPFNLIEGYRPQKCRYSSGPSQAENLQPNTIEIKLYNLSIQQDP
jgi:Family of unknown function (DUF6081)